MLKNLYIMRGLPGSGKSTLAEYIQATVSNDPVYLLSTDDYWVRPDGKYDFNYDLVCAAHKWNQNRVYRAMQGCHRHIIVDNVNINYKEIQPYALLAKAHGYTVVLVEADSTWAMDVEKCYQRNTHGVPYSTILRMYNSWEPSDSVYKKLNRLGVKCETKYRKS